MAELHRVEINEKAPNEIEPTEEKPAEAVEQQAEELPQEENDRPQWLPEKFKSAEDMAQAYSELEKKLGQAPKEDQAEAEQVEEKAENKEESQQLEFWKNKYDKLKPMNAAGYFDIEKSTLTSMLSVR